MTDTQSFMFSAYSNKYTLGTAEINITNERLSYT